MTKDIGRIRTTEATIRRVDNMRKIVDHMRNDELAFIDIQGLLQFSPSGARKYIRELVAFGAIEVARIESEQGVGNLHYQKTYYKLCDDESVIDKLFEMLGSGPQRAITDMPKKRLCSDPDRHFHIMSDDVNYQVRVPHKKIPAPDPLLAAFFGIGLS
jgi:hypothetical protein